MANSHGRDLIGLACDVGQLLCVLALLVMCLWNWPVGTLRLILWVIYILGEVLGGS